MDVSRGGSGFFASCSASTAIRPSLSLSATACRPAESRGLVESRDAGVPGAGPWLKTGEPIDDSFAETPDPR